MMDTVFDVLYATWTLAAQMAPYLILGFLIAGLLHAFLPVEFVVRHLGGEGLKPVVKAVLLGVPLPLCSCGVLPVAASLRSSGAGKAPTLAFLATTPVTGVDSLLATYSLLGLVFTLLRLGVSLVIGFFIGLLLALFGSRNGNGSSEPAASVCLSCPDDGAHAHADGWVGKLRAALKHGAVDVVESIAASLLLGLLLGGLITALVPADAVEQYVGTGVLGLLVATAVAVPLYVCATGSIPIAAAMVLKGFSPGAALAFLVAGPATNAVAITTTKKLLGWRAAILYLVAILVGAIGFGALIDVLGIGLSATKAAAASVGGRPSWWSELAGGVLLVWSAMLWFRTTKLYSGLKRFVADRRQGAMETLNLVVLDMVCGHCRRTVEDTLLAIDGVERVDADLSTKIVAVSLSRPVESKQLIEALARAGFSAKPVAGSG